MIVLGHQKNVSQIHQGLDHLAPIQRDIATSILPKNHHFSSIFQNNVKYLVTTTVSQPIFGVGKTGTFFIFSLSNGFIDFTGKPPYFIKNSKPLNKSIYNMIIKCYLFI